ncbi:hypothetical protein FBT53_05005 [Flavobacterium sp. ASW18X]|nr:hypothetical protein FBT53_05005 [Flavobacterium sp. ASW18X]
MKMKLNTNTLLSLTAMLVSVLTLVIFIYQTNLMRKQNYISILPYVQFAERNHSSGNVYELSLKNHGIGPAILESVQMIYYGEVESLTTYDNSIVTYLKSKNSALDSLDNFTFSTLNPGIAIPANQSYSFLKVAESAKDYTLITDAIAELLADGLEYKIVYKSIQDERWQIRSNRPSQGPEKLE